MSAPHRTPLYLAVVSASEIALAAGEKLTADALVQLAGFLTSDNQSGIREMLRAGDEALKTEMALFDTACSLGLIDRSRR